MAWDDEEEEKKSSGQDEQIKKLDELLRRAVPMLEQVHSLHSQFMAGVLSKPPLEERSRLDQLVTTLAAMPKPTPAYRFRFQNVQNTYNSYKTVWEKMFKDLESGKVKRPAGPKR